MDKPFRVAFVVPVHNEAAAIRTLIQELNEAILTPRANTALFVFEDGSTDGTKEILNEIDRWQLARVQIRTSNVRKGYPAAVRDAILSIDPAVYTHIFFMDSDRQYFVDDVERLLECAARCAVCDMVVGRRIKREDPLYRRALTGGLKIVERILFAPQIKDITSGLRCMKCASAQEIAAQVVFSKYNFWSEFTARAAGRHLNIIEVPVKHRQREEGESRVFSPSNAVKVAWAEFYAVVRIFIEEHWQHLSRFALVGASGAIVILLLTWLFTSIGGLWYMLSAALAIECSIFWAFALNTTVTFEHRFKEKSHLLGALAKYHATSLGGFSLNIVVLYILTEFVGIFYLVAELMAIIAAFMLNYLLSIRFVWRKTRRADNPNESVADVRSDRPN
jgi:dolichol-phosphate mannosyltransferase